MLGDIHGNFNYLKHLLNSKKVSDCYIIQVGDFGAGFTSDTNELNLLNDLNKFLNDRNIIMYAIRGNHDDPKYFDGRIKLTNLELVPDYTILDLEGNRIMCIGGAISVDRIPRISEDMINARYGITNRNYWYDEAIIFNEEAIINAKDINILVTHTAPDFCVPDNKFGFGYLVDEFALEDTKLKEDLKKERDLMTKIFDMLTENNNITTHFYGHFHRSNKNKIVNCEHILLDINELLELK